MTALTDAYVLEERAGDWLIAHAHYSLAPTVSGG